MSSAGAYRETYRRSLEDPDGFWLEAAQGIDWYTPPTRALDDSAAPLYRWFPDGVLNTCYNAVDRHVEDGRADSTALVYDSAYAGTCREYTYLELQYETSRVAGALRRSGVDKGDRVVIYMPMVPETIVTMLACARIGAVHSVVFGGFAANELAVRIDDAKPTVIVSASCGLEPGRTIAYKPILDAALERSTHTPDLCVVLQREQCVADLGERDVDYYDWVRDAPLAPCVELAATDPLYILYTSGTTGKPKGVVRDNGGHAVALHWSMANVYDTHQGEVFWAASDVGWVVGHSYIVYAPLLAGCTSVLYEGKPVGTPDAGAFWRVVSQHNVKALFTAPTAFRAIKKEDPKGEHRGRYELGSLKYLYLAGERLDPDTYHWAADLLDIPVIDHWWQTETGWPVAANCMGIEPLPVKPGSPTVPVPGYDVHVLVGDGDDAAPGDEGAIAIKLPLPPGTLPTLYNDDERYRESYLTRYDGYYLTGDGGHLDEDGYLYVMGRIDDVINVAGHRLSTGAIEEVVAQHPQVAECAVIGVSDPIKGQVPRGLVVLMAGADIDEQTLRDELVALVREQIGAVAAFRDVVVVPGLPKTRSGKILRGTMRQLAEGRHPDTPSTIEDPAVLDKIGPLLR